MDGGPGDDDIRCRAAVHLRAGPARTGLTRGWHRGASRYTDHATGVTVRLNGLADDGAAGEGDNVIGAVTGIQAGPATTCSRPGPTPPRPAGGAGNDRLVGSPERDTLDGGEGDDELSRAAATTSLAGGAGADRLPAVPDTTRRAMRER